MKFDDLLAQYLYENKKLQLQGIGNFELDNAVNVHQDNDKSPNYAIDGLNFVYNTREVTNEDLIIFLVRKLGKIEPLVRSDLDSYLSNIKQFLNIGKPYTIEGIGTLQKDNQGHYEFAPGNFIPIKEELTPRREKKERKERPEPSFRHEKKTDNRWKKVVAVTLIALASLAVLAGVGWGVYTLLVNRDKSTVTTSTVGTDDLATDTSLISVADTASSTLATNNARLAESARYKMVFEVTYSKKRAYQRTEYLKQLRVNANIDSVEINNVKRYSLWVPFAGKPQDTARVKDSLRIYFGRSIKIIAE